MARKAKSKAGPAGAAPAGKIALVLGGGGMRCAYVVGVLKALIEHYHFTEPDIIIAESGSAGSATYFITKQHEHSLATWLALADNKDFFSYYRRPMSDINYLIEHVLRATHPFDEQKLNASKIEFYVPVINAHTGQLVYLTPKKPNDVYQVLHAAKAIPILYNKTVMIDGIPYIDGGFGSDNSDHVRKAVELGATTIIEVRLVSKPTGFMRYLVEAYGLAWRFTRTGFYSALRTDLAPKVPYVPPNSVRIIPLQPKHKLPVGIMSTNRLAIRTTINIGYDDTVCHPALEELFCHHHETTH